MHNETLASEIIKNQQETIERIIRELDCLDAYFDKALFALGEVLELIIDIAEPQTVNEALPMYANKNRVDMFVGIAFDYVNELQEAINAIVIRELKGDSESEEE